ncbi:MAG: DUF6265 family protein [Bacteroidota bacterium]
MKHVIYFSFLVLFACSSEETTVDSHSLETNAEPDFSWLEGEWERINNAEGKETFEFWEKQGEEVYVGLGITLTQGDTTFKENLRIVPIDGEWTYEVTGVNETPTLFPMVEVRDQGFTSINEANEFPKRIDYSLKGDRLDAITSADSTQILFSFSKISIE